MKLINKDAVVAEIEARYNECLKRAKIIDAEYWNGKADAYRDMLVILNTLEVKEVDLEKEIIDWWNVNYSKKDYTFEGYTGHYLENFTVIEIAKHFFELGLSSQLSWQDVKRLSEIGETFMNSEESDNLSEEKYYTEILNKFKAQEGK